MQQRYPCPVCQSPQTTLWHTETRKPLIGREYHRCFVCQAVFVPEPFHLDSFAEQTIYKQHENNPNDPGYRKFLGRTLNAVVPHLPAQASGLDFGSGPGPTLHLMFQEHGFPCTTYDVYFDPVPERLTATYDFITATEVFEHLAHPYAVLTQLFQCLAPSGVLAIMTQKPTTKEAFSRWQYCLDPTHITFYRDATFDWMSRHLKAPIVHRGRDVVVFQKSAVD